MEVNPTNSVLQTMIGSMEENICISCISINNQLMHCRGRLEINELFVPENFLSEHKPKIDV